MIRPYRQADVANYKFLKANAVYNRLHPTQAEAVLWTQIRSKQLGVRFLRQYIISDFIVDFFCPSKQLIVEIDGKYHTDGQQQEYDILRQQKLECMGYKVLRFINEDVLCNIDQIICTIKVNL